MGKNKMVQEPLDKLLNKPMDRREFFAHLAYGLFILSGINALLKSLGNFSYDSSHPTKSSKDSDLEHGFGSSRFGI